MASNRNHGEEKITAMKTAILCTCVMAASTAFALDFNAPVEKLAGDFKFTEGPIWVAVKNELLFSDIPANRIVRFKDGKCETFRSASGNANGLTLDKQGRLIVCEHGPRRVTRTEADGTITGARRSLRRQTPQQPERRGRQERRRHLFHRSAVRREARRA